MNGCFERLVTSNVYRLTEKQEEQRYVGAILRKSKAILSFLSEVCHRTAVIV